MERVLKLLSTMSSLIKSSHTHTLSAVHHPRVQDPDHIRRISDYPPLTFPSRSSNPHVFFLSLGDGRISSSRSTPSPSPLGRPAPQISPDSAAAPRDSAARPPARGEPASDPRPRAAWSFSPVRRPELASADSFASCCRFAASSAEARVFILPPRLVRRGEPSWTTGPPTAAVSGVARRRSVVLGFRILGFLLACLSCLLVDAGCPGRGCL
jgi:hypothetical protein